MDTKKLTENNIRAQLDAFKHFGIEYFDLNVGNRNDETAPKRFWNHITAKKILDGKTIPYLRYANANNAHVYLRISRKDISEEFPVLSLDDISEDSLKKLTADGLRPQILIQTSPGNYGGWLFVPQKSLTQHQIKVMQVTLAKEYDLDEAAALQVGRGSRLVGFKHVEKDFFVRGTYSKDVVSKEAFRNLVTRSAKVNDELQSKNQKPKRIEINASSQFNKSIHDSYSEAVNYYAHKDDLNARDFSVVLSMMKDGFDRDQIAPFMSELAFRVKDTKSYTKSIDYQNRTLDNAEKLLNNNSLRY